MNASEMFSQCVPITSPIQGYPRQSWCYHQWPHCSEPGIARDLAHFERVTVTWTTHFNGGIFDTSKVWGRVKTFQDNKIYDCPCQNGKKRWGRKKKTPLNITCKDAQELRKLSEMDLGRWLQQYIWWISNTTWINPSWR